MRFLVSDVPLYWMLGWCSLSSGPALPDAVRVWGAGCRVQGAGFRVQGAGCRVQGAGNRDSGLRLEVAVHYLWGRGLGCWVLGFGFQQG